jgi:hypothetical protein
MDNIATLLKRKWAWFSQVFTAFVLIIAATLVFHSLTPDRFVQSAMASIPEDVKDQLKGTHDNIAKQPTVDFINLATDLGRLEFLSLSLTVLGVALAIGGIFGLFSFKSMAKEAAHKAALETAETNIRKLILSKEFQDSLRPDIEETIDTIIDKKLEETLEAKGVKTDIVQYDLSTKTDLDKSDTWGDEK